MSQEDVLTLMSQFDINEKIRLWGIFLWKGSILPNIKGFETQNNTLSQNFEAEKAQIILGTDNQQSSSDLKLDSILKPNLEELKVYVPEKL